LVLEFPHTRRPFILEALFAAAGGNLWAIMGQNGRQRTYRAEGTALLDFD
jgi:hypothetical protein